MSTKVVLRTNLLEPKWLQHIEGTLVNLKAELRNFLWVGGWRDGVELKMTETWPVIMFEFEKDE